MFVVGGKCRCADEVCVVILENGICSRKVREGTLSPLEVNRARIKRRRSGDGKEVVESDDCVIELLRSVK